MNAEAQAEPIRPAATTVLLRRTANGPQVLMGQRGAGAVFMPSKYVFPGGAVDATDADVPLARPLDPRAARMLQAAPGPHALAIAAIRELWEEGLSRFGGPYLGGAEFSAVDAFFAPVAFRIRTYGLDVGAGQAWVDHILAHPAMLDWERQALAESWREVGHEEELRACGAITADYRTG